MLQARPASAKTHGGTNLFEIHMALHSSLRSSSTLGAKRNVLKRFERVELLRKRNQWKAGDRVVGLPKTKPNE